MILWLISHIKQLLVAICILFLTCAALMTGKLQMVFLLLAIVAGAFTLFFLLTQNPNRQTITMEPLAAALEEGEPLQDQI